MFLLRDPSSGAHAVALQSLAFFLIIFYALYFLSLAVAVMNVARLQEVLTHAGICLHSGSLARQPHAEIGPEEEALGSPGQGAADLALSVPTTTITKQALSGKNAQGKFPTTCGPRRLHEDHLATGHLYTYTHRDNTALVLALRTEYSSDLRSFCKYNQRQRRTTPDLMPKGKHDSQITVFLNRNFLCHQRES
ncbi:hypothetical protein E5288_WYG012416 [Bos mutus]|uniref:Uncharacterized protein n=1 Tax=Bos mutus TaxID=72004 RepID=A0A6B0RST0_9CETA|nr:hypothetical protein [Bos mutus]